MNKVLKNIHLSDIKPYPNNPRKNDRAIEALAKSIATFGFQAPLLLDENLVILAGHTRYKAAQKLGLKSVPCVISYGLEEAQKTAYRIADNKTAELAIWDTQKLDEEIAKLDWAEIDDAALNIDWSELSEGLAHLGWDELDSIGMDALGFTTHEAQAFQADTEIASMLDAFEASSPVRDREQKREQESLEPAAEEEPQVVFIATGKRADFGEDFWELASKLYARGVKTETKERGQSHG